MIKTTEEISSDLKSVIKTEKKATYNQIVSINHINKCKRKRWFDYDELMKVIDGLNKGANFDWQLGQIERELEKHVNYASNIMNNMRDVIYKFNKLKEKVENGNENKM
jgi:hypothetical protein